MASVAVIGAGLAGLVTAKILSPCHDVTVFEKSHGVGGRMATRRYGNYQFDHGAQFFTARTPEFGEFLRPMIDAGVVACWNARFVELARRELIATRRWDDSFPHYVGAPAMSEPGKWLAAGLVVRLQTPITRLDRQGPRWRLGAADGSETRQFDWVVITAPAAQTAALLPEGCRIRAHSETALMLGCYSLMLADPRPLALPWEAALVHDADISWISVDSSKPGRSAAYCLLVHSTNEWADEHIEDDPESVTAHLLAECSAVIGIDASAAAHRRLHRWRYANMDLRTTQGYGIDADMRLAACGDWFLRGRVEAAFTSAFRLGEALRSYL